MTMIMLMTMIPAIDVNSSFRVCVVFVLHNFITTTKVITVSCV